MTIRSGILAGILLGCALGGPPPVAAQRGPGQDEFSRRYGVIVERNIFTRDRGRRNQPTPTRQESRPAPVVPEKSYVLRGVSLWGSEYIAFVENTRYGETHMYRVGNTILEGKITRITLDSIEVAKGTETTTVQLGNDLTGQVAGSALTLQELISRTERTAASPDAAGPDAETADTAPAAAPAAGTETGTGTATGTGADADDILRQLLERRKKELQQ
ncbi:MAG: hypothetical protein JW810_01165 [Sedimentisphaerales bacterium]|nr:hypothetical protein [Sedimentisphaerales bacterium]